MANELAFTLINPYTISKSRTGGAIGRISTRTGLKMVAAWMFGPSAEMADAYARQIEESVDINAAHASDSPENAALEMGIVKSEEDRIAWWTEKYYG